MRQVWDNDKGLTLIELMIALSLLGLVVSGGYSIFYFAHQSFVKSTITADIQRDMQLALIQMANSLRTAYQAEYFDTRANSLPRLEDLQPDEIIILIQNGKLVMYKTPAPVVLAGGHEDLAQYEVIFRPVRDSGVLLQNVVEVELKAGDNQMAVSVMLLNLRDKAIEGDPGAGADAFRYRAVRSLDDLEENGGGQDLPARCFIATAVYGSEAWPTNTLRRFRDRVLLPTSIGRVAVDLYYIYSPYVAVLLGKSHLLRWIAGTALVPFVVVAFICVNWQWVLLAAFAAALLRHRRRL